MSLIQANTKNAILNGNDSSPLLSGQNDPKTSKLEVFAEAHSSNSNPETKLEEKWKIFWKDNSQINSSFKESFLKLFKALQPKSELSH